MILITLDGFPARMLDDPRAVLPNLRALAATGARAQAMIVSNPATTWSNHTTLVTGVLPRKHSVMANGLLVRGGVDVPIRNEKEKTVRELVATPSLFDLLHADHRSTAGVNWPCTRSSASIDDNFPDSPGMLNFTTPRLLRELVAARILGSDQQSDFARMEEPGHDAVWTRTACHLIRTRMPDFMAVHLLNTDEIHHAYGPESLASYAALALADRFVGDVVAAVDAAGQTGNTTLFVVADHGFATATHVLQPNVILRQANLLNVSAQNKIVRARVQVVTLGGIGFVYCTNPATRASDRQKVTELFSGREGVAELIGPERFAQLGLPNAGEGGAGDLILRAKAGYGIVNTATGEDFIVPATIETNIGFHGYLADLPEMNALFIASGRGIKSGARLGIIQNVDIAPTIMHLFGWPLSATDGRVLTEIFDRP